MIHQHFMLVPTLTVVENVALGLRSSRSPRLNLDRVAARLRQLSTTYGLEVDPHLPVWQLAVGEQQRVEIVKVLYRGASLLVLDEPTAVLTPQEVAGFFAIVRRMAAEGHAIIFISHKLHEVLNLSHRITILHDGRVVGTLPTAATSQAELARLMVGRDLLLHRQHEAVPLGAPRLQVQALTVQGDRGTTALKGVSFEVRAGEILGLAGVSGNGQRELAESLAGLRAPTQGQVFIDGQPLSGASPATLRRAGLAYIPEERLRTGTIQEFSVAENMILQAHAAPPFAHGIFLDFAAIAQQAARLVREFGIKTPSPDTPVKALSGGNIQKLILARELASQPGVLIASQPTRGVDIGTSDYIHQRLLEQRKTGTATLLISEDLDEIRRLSDRIAVLYEGRIVGIVPADTPVETLGLLMAGGQLGAALPGDSP